MKYSELVEVYENLSATTKRLEKTSIIASFLKKLKTHGESKWIYLLRGRVLPDYDARELGISGKLVVKVISKSSGSSPEEVVKKYNKLGDLGDVAESLLAKKRQATLFSSKLSVGKVFDNLENILDIEGKGSVDKKLALILELMSNANGKEAKYIVRIVLGILRVGVADSTIRDAMAEAFFPKDKKEMSEKIENVYDLANDFALVFEATVKGRKELAKINIHPGKPMHAMLPVKVTELREAFRICGAPCAIEHKYDGFRVLINKDKGVIKLFTRRLDDVTTQFPDVVEVVKKYVKGNSFILDSEVVGYDPITKKTRPFEAISQRIRRKYHIDRLKKELPVEINTFDVIYYNGKSLINESFEQRRKILEKIVPNKKLKIRTSTQIVTGDKKRVEEFYRRALELGEEGIMFKKLDAEYKPGRRVGFMVKLKPVAQDLDLVITAAEYGSGKRFGELTSYIVACQDNGKFKDVGKVASGLKEKEEQGLTYSQMTKMLNPLIIKEKGRRVIVKPKIIVAVTYQNIQKSPTYSSGFALRFPRITAVREDKPLKEINTLRNIKKEFDKN
ncbi:MAG: ATP-dependent DNA ligase [Nanoarchaeota archaeon]|nr:ATP-dependent DNA ligase [Nanoarchaeota archaeon]